MLKVKPVYRVLITLFAIGWAVITLLPFYLMFITSLKSHADYGVNGFFSFPKEFVFSNYATVIDNGIFRYFLHSLLLLAVSLSLLVFIGLCAAYPLSRMKFKLRKPLHSAFVAAMAIPIHVTLIPVFLLTRSMGLYDTLYGLIGPYVAFGLPGTVFILSSFMREIPKEIEDSAQIDGCNKYRMFGSIIVPLSKTSIVTVAIFNAITMWNEFSFALVLTQSPESRTLPLAIWNYKGQYATDVPLLFCVLMISVIPMIIAFVIGQDKLIKGMMAGAIKG